MSPATPSPPPAASRFPEEELLRALLRAADGALPSPSPPPGGGLDWDTFLGLVRSHGVAHAARAGLERLGAAAVPAEVARALERMIFEVRSVNVLLLDRLGKLALLLDGAGVEFLVLKGPVLLDLLYRDVGERPMTDLDLLVRRRDLDRALEALERAGLKAPQGGERLFWETHYHHIALSMGRDLPVNVEVHWDLELRERYPLPLDELWARAIPFQAGGRTLRTLERLDLYLFGAIHLARHFYAPRLLWLIDQRRMARAWDLDWREVRRRAAAYRACTPLWFVAAYEERVFGSSSVPEAARPALRPLQGRLLRSLESPRPLVLLRDVARESRRVFATLLFFDHLGDLALFLWRHWSRKAARWSGLERWRRSRA